MEAGAPLRAGRALRIAFCVSSLILASVALVSVLRVSTGRSELQVSRSSILTPAEHFAVNNIALSLLRSSSTASEAELSSQISGTDWQKAVHVAAFMQQTTAAPLQMLAVPPSMMITQRGRFGSVLADDEGESPLCKKRQFLIDTFNKLLRRLGVDVGRANQTMDQVSKEFKDSMTAWLDAESAYRLSVQRAKEAKEGATFATEEYEKWAQAHKQAKKTCDETLKQHAAEKQELLNEKEVIKEIMRLIGVLHDVKATGKSIAAGGRDSVVNPETGVSDPYNIKIAQAKAQLMAKMAQLKQISHNTKVGVKGSEKLAQLSDQKLAVYSETEEVANILKEMLADLDAHMNIIDEMDIKAQEMVTSTFNKMVEWEKQMVALSDAADKARRNILASEDKREVNEAHKRVETVTYTKEKQHYDLTLNPFQREIYIIMLIKDKIIEHCEKEDTDRAAAANAR